jgi:toxin ParE1/3/4
MPQPYSINLTQIASGHLADVFDYIAADSGQNAVNVMQRLLDAINTLDSFPRRYPILQGIDTHGLEVHSMPVPPYLVRYHIDDASKVVTVLSVRHGARRPGL